MADAIGGGVTGAEGSEWHCPACGAVHGYTCRENGITRLRVVLNGRRSEWTGDGGYECPNCGAWVPWVAGLATYRRLMAHYAGTR